ncbi:MAG: exosortase E/protease, VPEID-CTERM system [Pseudomonadales bacterium]
MKRAIFLVGLLAAELLAVSFAFDARTQDAQHAPDSWLAYLAHAGTLARFLSVAAAATLLLLTPRLRGYLNDLNAHARRSLVLGTSIHLAAAAAFFAATAVVFSVPSVLTAAQYPMGVTVWLLTGMALATTWAHALAPWSFWCVLVRAEWPTLAMGLLAGAVASLFAASSQSLWDPLAYAALRLSHATLALVYDDVYLDLDTLALGVKDFVVLVGAPCSGYEGIGLISVFTALYLFMFRREFRFPRALLLLPAGIVVIWLFNVLRIVVLIMLGAEMSPEIALGGFHSQAGWVSFLLVSLGLLLVMHRTGFAAAAAEPTKRIPVRQSLPAATLAPLLALLAVALATGLVSADIDLLYGLRVLAGVAVLALVWRTLALPRPPLAWPPIAVGGGVFLLWILMVAPDPEAEAATASALAALPTWAWALWMVARVLGAAIVVPLVEELAFRGYLLCRLAGQEVVLQGRLRLSWWSLAASSVLFGVMHDAWLAGTVAGAAYAVTRLRGESIWAPILAHGTTNLLLAAYVLRTGHWSLW